MTGNQPPRSTQPGHPFMHRCNEYWWKLGCKQLSRDPYHANRFHCADTYW